MLRSMPFMLIIVISMIVLVDPIISFNVKQILYAMSLTVKSGIVFVLPFIIFSLLFKTMVKLASKATVVIGLILLCVCCSNFMATFLSHYVGEWIYQLDLAIIQPTAVVGLTPAWSCHLPALLPNNMAMFAGIVLGIVAGNWNVALASRIADQLNRVTTTILISFKYLIPIFVAGFVVKLQYDGVVGLIVKDYAPIFGMIALAQFSYLLFAYALLSRFKVRATFSAIKNMLPAAIAGFSTMSSAAVMPLTIEGAASNATNKDLARSVVPATVNIHLMGDCIAIPIFAYALMKSFAMPMPGLGIYLVFVCYFVLAKFSVAAIPGGGIIVMLPILENYLGFTPEMLSLITALYILFDPVITCANVLGNGAFSKLIDRLIKMKIKTVGTVVLEREPPPARG